MRHTVAALLLCFLTLVAGTKVCCMEIYSFSEKMEKIDEAAALQSEEGVRILIDYLLDSDLKIRTRATSKLIDMGEMAIPTLISSIGDERLRWLVSGALINIGDPARRPLVLALKDEDPAVRRNSLFVLGQLSAVEAAPSIQRCLEDPDISVQIQAIHTISKLGGEGALRLVAKKMNDPDRQVRNAAIEGMSYFGEEAIPYLLSNLNGEDPEKKIGAIKSLGMIDSSKGIPYIQRALHDRNPGVRYQACLTLGTLKEKSVVEDLAKMFNDPNPDVREAANNSIANFAEEAETLLVGLLKNGSTLEKINAAIVVRKVRMENFSPLLVDMIDDPVPDVKVAAIAGLMELEDPETIEPLVNSLLEEDIRWFSVIALRRFGHKNLKPILRRSNNPDLDYWKQYVLEGMDEKAIDGIVEYLDDEDLAIKVSSICTLRQIKNTRAVYPLIQLLKDDNLGTLVRSVLTQMGEVAVEPLIASLYDTSPKVRARAALALGDVGLVRVVDPLKNLLDDVEPEVREAAKESIEKITRESGEESGGRD